MPAAASAATHAELARLIARGDRKRAASLLVRDHAPAVFALCRAMVRDPRLAEDLSQDAFARAFGALDGFRGEASPRTWLLKIARNRCLDHLDRVRRAPWGHHADHEPDDHAADEPPPYDLLARREDAERAVAVLGESERALVVLHFGHGVGYPELADSFGLRAGTVRMRISRALARMRAALDFELEAPTPVTAARAGSAFDHLGASAAFGSFEEAESEATAWAGASADRAGDAVARGEADGGADESLAEARMGAAPGAFADEDFGLDELGAVPPAAYAFDDCGDIPPTFDSLREDLSPALRRRLDSLAAAI